MHKRILTLLTMFSLATALLIGCGGSQEEPTQAEAATTTETIELSEVTNTQTETEDTTPEATEEPHTHNYAEVITTAATCEADGLKTFTCVPLIKKSQCSDNVTKPVGICLITTDKLHLYQTVI